MASEVKIVSHKGTPVNVSGKNRLLVEATFSSTGEVGSGVGEVRIPIAKIALIKVEDVVSEKVLPEVPK